MTVRKIMFTKNKIKLQKDSTKLWRMTRRGILSWMAEAQKMMAGGMFKVTMKSAGEDKSEQVVPQTTLHVPAYSRESGYSTNWRQKIQR